MTFCTNPIARTQVLDRSLLKRCQFLYEINVWRCASRCDRWYSLLARHWMCKALCNSKIRENAIFGPQNSTFKKSKSQNTRIFLNLLDFRFAIAYIWWYHPQEWSPNHQNNSYCKKPNLSFKPLFRQMQGSMNFNDFPRWLYEEIAGDLNLERLEKIVGRFVLIWLIFEHLEQLRGLGSFVCKGKSWEENG